MSEPTPKVAVLIVNWNRKDDTLDCLRSLTRLTYSNYRIILVDNGSQDGSVAAVAAEFPAVKIIPSETNLRFAGGNNLGLRDVLQGDDDFVLLLNNDTTVDPDVLDHLLTAAQSDASVGLVGPKILYHDRPDIIWFAGGIIKPAWGYVRHWGLRQIDDGTYDRMQEVTFLTGCCLLIGRPVLENVGLLDEGFFLYSEDADYCLRARKAGYKLIYQSQARIYHKVSQSTAGRFKWQKWYLRYRSLFRLVKKHTSPLTWPLFGLNLLWEAISLPVNLLLQTRKLSSHK